MEQNNAYGPQAVSNRMKTCDIIIPTYNAGERLVRTLSALVAQETPPGWAVRLIVSDDGSAENVEPVVRRYAKSGPWLPPLILLNSHEGRSRTRNQAIDRATAQILLFLADDMVLRPRALWEHLRFHEEHQDEAHAALGCVVWDPSVRVTPFMDWMMHGGQQNDYDAIAGKITCDPEHYFYGSFISMKRAFLGDARFSEEFSEYGWEDLELGRRLKEKELQLFVLHRALALHRHAYAAQSILLRQQIVGSAKYLVNTNSIRRMKHELYRLSGGRALMRSFMKKWGDSLNMPRIFEFVTAGEFWYGVHHANRVLKRKNK